ncbi:Nn.00g028150.m01.CDS01 [Neocucurbitaria sp. VM-36]
MSNDEVIEDEQEHDYASLAHHALDCVNLLDATHSIGSLSDPINNQTSNVSPFLEGLSHYQHWAPSNRQSTVDQQSGVVPFLGDFSYFLGDPTSVQWPSHDYSYHTEPSLSVNALPPTDQLCRAESSAAQLQNASIDVSPLAQLWSAQENQYQDQSNICFGTFSPHGTQNEAVSYDAQVHDDAMNLPPDTDISLNGFLSGALTSQSMIPNNFQSQPIVSTRDEVQLDATSNTAALPATSNVPQTTGNDPFRCPKGCPRSLARPADYRRHMEKHGRPKFKCAIYDCNKTFYRKDKLQAHHRQGHKLIL